MVDVRVNTSDNRIRLGSIGIGKPDPLRQPADMGVHRDPFVPAQRMVKHDVRSLPANPRDRQELIHGPGHFTAK